MAKIEELIIDSLKVADEKFKDDDSVKNFEQYQKEFKKLVEKGVAKERGNNLLSASDAHIKTRVFYNTNI